MVLKGYFDGGNQDDPSRYDRITLGVACGTAEQWTPAEAAWNAVRDKHNAPPLHTTDAIGLRRDFSRKKGWTNERVDRFIEDCVSVIEQHTVTPGRLLIPVGSGTIPSIARNGLNIFTFTVLLHDYIHAKKFVPLLPDSCTDLCVSETLGIVARWGRRIGAEHYELYFDRGEPFFGHAYDRWTNRDSKKQINFMKDVVHCGSTNASVSPALQIADLFAWSGNHTNDVRRNWHMRLNALAWDSFIMEFKHLLNPTPGALERTENWKLRPRKLQK